jgi:hypothetical protein
MVVLEERILDRPCQCEPFSVPALMAGWSSWSSFCLLFFLFIGKVTGELVNRTIDDMYGDYAATDKNGRGEVAYYPDRLGGTRVKVLSALAVLLADRLDILLENH